MATDGPPSGSGSTTGRHPAVEVVRTLTTRLLVIALLFVLVIGFFARRDDDRRRDRVRDAVAQECTQSTNLDTEECNAKADVFAACIDSGEDWLDCRRATFGPLPGDRAAGPVGREPRPRGPDEATTTTRPR